MGTNFTSLQGECNLKFLKNLQMLIYPELCDSNYLLIIFWQKYDSVFLSSCFFFRVMAHWFGRLPLPCAGVVGVFPKNLVRAFKLTVTNSRVFVLFVCQVSVDSNNQYMKDITLVIFPVFLTNYCAKSIEKFVQRLRFIFFSAQNFQTFGQLFVLCFVFLILAFSIKL